MEDQAEIIRKIGLLLKKAEGTDNEHEANAFYEKANDLMVRYAIEEQRVRLAQEAEHGRHMEEPIVVDFMFASYAHHANAKETLLDVVARSQNVRSLPYPNRKDSNHRREGNNGLHESQWTRLIGYATDIEFTKILYVSLLIQSTRFAAEDWNREFGKGAKKTFSGLGKFTWTSNHMEGFADRIGARFRELKEDILASVKDGSALILDKDANIQEWMYEKGILRRPVEWCYERGFPSRKVFKAKSTSYMWYCGLKKGHEPVEEDDAYRQEGHSFTVQPRVSYSRAVGSYRSSEGRSSGHDAGNRADIGSTRMTSGTGQIKG